MQQLKYIIKYLLSLINDPEQTWKYLKDGDVDEAKHEYMQNNYSLPLMGVVTLFLFLKTGWGDRFDIETAIKAATSFAAAFFVGPILANVLMRQTYGRMMNFTFDNEKLNLFIGYSLSFLMLVRMFSASFPHIRFLTFCSFYLFYIIWCAADVYIGIGEKERWKFTVAAFFEIWLSPIIIEKLMSMMMY